MGLRDEQSAFVADIVALTNYAWQLGFDVVYGEFQRPVEMQEIYVRTGRSKTRNSNHLKKLAGDLYFFWRPTGELVLDERLKPIGDYWESLSPSNSWGGNWNSFKDLPHFERRA